MKVRALHSVSVHRIENLERKRVVTAIHVYARQRHRIWNKGGIDGKPLLQVTTRIIDPALLDIERDQRLARRLVCVVRVQSCSQQRLGVSDSTPFELHGRLPEQ